MARNKLQMHNPIHRERVVEALRYCENKLTELPPRDRIHHLPHVQNAIAELQRFHHRDSCYRAAPSMWGSDGLVELIGAPPGTAWATWIMTGSEYRLNLLVGAGISNRAGEAVFTLADFEAFSRFGLDSLSFVFRSSHFFRFVFGSAAVHLDGTNFGVQIDLLLPILFRVIRERLNP